MSNQTAQSRLSDFRDNLTSWGLGVVPHALFFKLDTLPDYQDPIEAINQQDTIGDCRIRNDGTWIFRHSDYAIVDIYKTDAEKKEEERLENGGLTNEKIRYLQELSLDNLHKTLTSSLESYAEEERQRYYDFYYNDKIELTAGTYAGEAVYLPNGLKYVPVYSTLTGEAVYNDTGLSCEVPKETLAAQPLYWDNGMSCEIALPSDASAKISDTQNDAVSFGLAEQPDLLKDLNLKLLPEGPTPISAAEPIITAEQQPTADFNAVAPAITADPNKAVTPITVPSLANLSAQNDPVYKIPANGPAI